MGDLKVGENFEDRVYITSSATGAAQTGLAPTCTIIDESGNRSAGTVAEMASGWYKVTDFTPDAAGTWCLEWAVAGAYTLLHPAKEFKVGGGTLADIETELTFEHQTPVSLNQNNPVSAQPYDVLVSTNNVRIYSITAWVTWTVQPDPLTLVLTIDGNAYTITKNNPASGTVYMVKDRTYNAAFILDAVGDRTLGYLVEGRNISLTAAVTGGTVSNITCWCKYGKR